MREIDTRDVGRSLVEGVHAGQDVQQRGFSATGRTEEGDHLARSNVEVGGDEGADGRVATRVRLRGAANRGDHARIRGRRGRLRAHATAFAAKAPWDSDSCTMHQESADLAHGDPSLLGRIHAVDPAESTLVEVGSSGASVALGTRITRTGPVRRLESVQLIERPLDEVFPFFERPENLAAITPRWLAFRILTPSPVPMHVHARIDYRLSVFGLPFRWRTRIERHEVGRGFVDVQESGPFAVWRHTHEFHAVPGGTRMHDVVEFRAPLGPLGSLAHAAFVDVLVRRIFTHRRARISEILGPAKR